jgi:hypothetical protein
MEACGDRYRYAVHTGTDRYIFLYTVPVRHVKCIPGPIDKFLIYGTGTLCKVRTGTDR